MALDRPGSQEHASADLPDRYRVMIERSPFGILLVDAGDCCRYLNDAACALTGYAREEMLGRNLLDLLPEQLREFGRRHFAQIRGREIEVAELPFPRRDGTECWWSVRAVLLDGGRFLGYIRDITGRRTVDLNLQREQARLDRVGDVARVGWWEFDFNTGRAIGSSHARDIYGLPPGQDFTIALVQEIPLPECRPYLDAAQKDLVDGVRPYDVTFRIRRPVDGELADIRSLAEYDRERNVMFGVLQDITAQKQAETALRESEARLRAIFDSAQDYIFLKDRELRYTHVNQACQELLRRPMAEIVGRTDAELFPPQYVEQIQATDRRVLAGEATRDVYERRLNDETAVVETIKVPVCNDAGEVVGICGVSRDITEVRRLEERLQQAQKMEAVGRLAGGVAHDFNNLLTPILGFADLLLHSHAEDDPRRKDLRAITRAAERARDLTAQLLAFGRKQVLDMKVVDLNDVVRESEPMLRRLLRENIQLNLVLAPALGAVRADVSQLHNVLINLVVNAADAMRDGGTLGIETQNVELDTEYIRAHPGSRPGPHVLLAVSDDGCGMDPETLSIVFEPFFTTKDAHEGTGLGLSTVLGIVQQHQGSITVYSEPKHGSVFKVYLPRVDARPATLPAGGETRPLYGSERVLLVEDDDAVRGLTAAALAKYGYTVVPAATPAAALELLADGIQPCDLLITDVVMPGMNGAQLHRALLGAWSRLPALFISGYTSDIIAHHGILAEGLHYLQKPFTPRDLAAKARQVLDG